MNKEGEFDDVVKKRGIMRVVSFHLKQPPSLIKTVFSCLVTLTSFIYLEVVATGSQIKPATLNKITDFSGFIVVKHMG